MLSTESGPLINNGNLFSGEMLELVELSNESFESFTETLSHLNQFCDFLDDYVVKSGENWKSGEKFIHEIHTMKEFVESVIKGGPQP